MDYMGIEYLRRKLKMKERRVNLRYKFYDMKQLTRDLGIATPPSLRNWQSVLGWNAKAVDSLADRLIFREFTDDTFDLNGIYNMNNKDVLFDSAILGALIGSCDFIYIHEDESGFPVLEVIDGANATGIMDVQTGMLKEGYAVLERDEYDHPLTEAYFLPHETWVFRKGKEAAELFESVAPYPLLVPIVYRPDAKRPFGHSRISRACMELTGSAIRTLKRSEISAEFFSFPQRYAVGMSDDAAPMDKWKATMSTLLTITKDADGDHPVLGQFPQQSMAPHTEQLKMFASLFAGETGLTLDDMGFPTDNPSSAEAIKAAHENLRLAARKAQRTFSTGFINAGYLAACIRDKYEYRRQQIYLTTPKWYPVFEPDSAMLSSIGDGAIKINQAIPGYVDRENLYDLTGIKGGGLFE